MKTGWVGFCKLSTIWIYLLRYLSAKFLWLLSVHWVLIRLFKSNLASRGINEFPLVESMWKLTVLAIIVMLFSNSLKMCWMKENEWRIKNEYCPLGEHLYDCRIKGFESFSHLYNWQCDSREVTWTLWVFSGVFSSVR